MSPKCKMVLTFEPSPRDICLMSLKMTDSFLIFEMPSRLGVIAFPSHLQFAPKLSSKSL